MLRHYENRRIDELMSKERNITAEKEKKKIFVLN